MKKGIMRFFILFVLVNLAFTGAVLAQEICDNGIDDDSDGLIDLNDPDCACDGISALDSSIIPNPSFEAMINCPMGFSQLDSVMFWEQASEATSDYIHECGEMAEDFIRPPQPFPDGKGCIGIIGYKTNTALHDYVGTCLNNPLQKDTSYTLKFHVGFGIKVNNTYGWDSVVSTSPFEMTLYGHSDCMQLPFSGTECPTAFVGSNWEPIQSIEVRGKEEWVEANFKFKPTKNYKAIILGAPCGSKNLGDVIEYYFLDNLILSETKNFGLSPPKVSGSICDSNIELSSPKIDPSFEYQWYENGVALVDDTLETLYLGGGNIGGNYQVRISKDNECQISQTIDISSSIDLQIDIEGPDVICENSTAILQGPPGFESYRWSTNDTTKNIEVATGGTYNLSMTDSFGCVISTSFDIDGPVSISLNPTIRNSESTNDNGSIRLNPSGGSAPYSYMWANDSTGNSMSNLSSGTYSVTVEDANGCTKIDSFFVDFIPDDLEANIRVNNLDCYQDNSGRITLEVNGGMPELSVLWNTGDTSLEIDNLSAGSYSVTITDAVGDRLVLNTSVEQPDPLTVSTVQLTEPSCNGFSNGEIVPSITGGTPTYTYQWNGDTSTTAALSNIPAGSYQLTVIDDHGCSLSEDFELQEPEALNFDWEKRAPSCYGFEDGFIKISDITGGTGNYTVLLNNKEISDNGDLSLTSGEYILHIEDDNSCFIEETIVLESPPNIEVEASADENTIMKGGMVRLSGMIIPEDLTNFQLQWNSNTVDPQIEDNRSISTIARPQRSTTFTLLLDKNGCIYSDEVFVEVSPTNFYAPNAFSPNGDGKNDVFNFASNSSQGLLIKDLMIFDRWGNLMHNVRNISLSQYEGWDGSYQGSLLKTGVYVYHITLENGRGEVFRYAGNVLLKR